MSILLFGKVDAETENKRQNTNSLKHKKGKKLKVEKIQDSIFFVYLRIEALILMFAPCNS